MQPDPPFWFKQRQAKLDAAGENTFKVTAPNQGEAYLVVRRGEDGRWVAAIRATAAGEDLDATESASEADAWQAAFELYRRAMVI